jgi:hypothetical protein
MLQQLHLRSNGLDDAVAQGLADAIKYNRSLSLLNLSHNNITSVGAKAIAGVCKQTFYFINVLREECLIGPVSFFHNGVSVLKCLQVIAAFSI